MLSKIIILIACTLLLATLFNIANAEDVCVYYQGGLPINSTAIKATNDVCGTQLKTSSCCTDETLGRFEKEIFVFPEGEFSPSCASVMKVATCGACYLRNQKYITDRDGFKMCKSFCEKFNSACKEDKHQPLMKCEGLPETDCYNSVAINKVSAFVMTLVVMMLGIFAL